MFITNLEPTPLVPPSISIKTPKPSRPQLDSKTNKLTTPGNSWLTVVELLRPFFNGRCTDAAKLTLTPLSILERFNKVKSLHSHGVSDSKSNIDENENF